MYVGIAHSNQARHVKNKTKKRSTSRLRVLLISFVQKESEGRPLSGENSVFHHFPFILLLHLCDFEDISGTLSFLLCWRCGNH